MNIFLTGSSGLIGREVLKKFSKSNFIYAIIKSKKKKLFKNKNIKYIVQNLEKKFDFNEKIDAVIHLAAKVQRKSKINSNQNYIITKNILEATAPACKKFIFASSQMVYGNINEINIREDKKINENKLDNYGSSKIKCEKLIKKYQKKYRGSYYSLRFSGIIEGAGFITYAINCILQKKKIHIFSNGKVMRNYLSLSDCVKSIFLTAKMKNIPNYHTINVSSGMNLDNISIISKLFRLLSINKKIFLTNRPAPIQNLTMDISKAKKILKFKPETFDRSLKNYLKNFELYANKNSKS